MHARKTCKSWRKRNPARLKDKVKLSDFVDDKTKMNSRKHVPEGLTRIKLDSVTNRK